MTKDPAFGSLPRQAYSGSLLERAAALRGDDAKLAAFLEHPRAGVYVVGGELIVLKAQGAAPDPLFSPDEARTLGVARETVFLGLLHDAPRFGVGIDPAAIEALKARADLKLIDLRTIAVQGEVDTVHRAAARRSQGDPRLARAPSLLSQLQRGHRTDSGRLAARLPGVQGRAFSAHRSGGDHAADQGRPLRARPLAALSADHVVVPRRLLRARRIDRGSGAPRSRRGGRRGLRAGPIFCLAALAVSVVADDRLPRRSCQPRVVIDKSEIEDARWFDRAELKTMLLRQHPQELSTPPPIAIAHHIIRDFVEHGSEVLIR